MFDKDTIQHRVTLQNVETAGGMECPCIFDAGFMFMPTYESLPRQHN